MYVLPLVLYSSEATVYMSGRFNVSKLENMLMSLKVYYESHGYSFEVVKVPLQPISLAILGKLIYFAPNLLTLYIT